MTDIQTIVIVGAGLTGVKAAEALRKEGYDGRIVMLGEEDRNPYLRPPLSKAYLRHEADPDHVFIHPEAWYAEQRIELRRSTRVVQIDPAARRVVLDDGHRLSFDRLLIATGAEPRRLEIPGRDLAGVHELRTLDDADAVRDALAGANRVVVIGGGWIGAEVAATARDLGLPVAMVAASRVPLERALGAEVGAVFRDLHADHGVELVMGRRAVGLMGRGSVRAVRTADGRRIEGDLVVVGAGARPRTALAERAGLDVGDGILVDEHLETSAPGIFAAGDVAAAWNPFYGARLRLEHWDNARRQGRTAARNLLGMAEPYARIPYLYSDQYDVAVEYAGHAPAWDRIVYRGEPASRAFIAFWLLGSRVVAGMNSNVPRVNGAIAGIIGSREPVDVERLVDPAVPLDDPGALRGQARAAVR